MAIVNPNGPEFAMRVCAVIQPLHVTEDMMKRTAIFLIASSACLPNLVLGDNPPAYAPPSTAYAPASTFAPGIPPLPPRPSPPLYSATVERPAMPLPSPDELNSKMLVVISKEGVRCFAGRQRIAEALESMPEKSTPDDQMLVFCEECDLAPGDEDSGPARVRCAGDVLMTTAQYEARAGQMTIIGSRLHLEARKQSGSESFVVLHRKLSGKGDGECYLTAKRIVFDSSTDHAAVGSALEATLPD